MTNIKVSIVIPTYNDQAHIINAINSVLSQSFKNFEIIVIDDGSIDNTSIILKDYIESKKIIYIYQENSGVCSARNNGISISSGKYISFLDSDDEWIDKDKLKKQVDFLESNENYVLVGTCGVVVDDYKNKITDYNVSFSDLSIRKSILIKNPFLLSSVMVRKDILVKTDLFIQKDYINAEDYNLWLRISLLGKISNLSESMVSYTLRDGGISLNYKKDILKGNILFIKEFKYKYSNYIIGLSFAYIKIFIYTFLSYIKNKKIKDKIIYFLFKKYRKL